MNTELLREVQAAILKEPNQVDMGTWGGYWVKRRRNPHLYRCGTAGCIAGWACAIATEERDPDLSIESRAADLLELTEEEKGRLFFVSAWPECLQNQIGNARLFTRGYAEIVARRIEHFIETGGVE